QPGPEPCQHERGLARSGRTDYEDQSRPAAAGVGPAYGGRRDRVGVGTRTAVGLVGRRRAWGGAPRGARSGSLSIVEGLVDRRRACGEPGCRRTREPSGEFFSLASPAKEGPGQVRVKREQARKGGSAGRLPAPASQVNLAQPGVELVDQGAQ